MSFSAHSIQHNSRKINTIVFTPSFASLESQSSSPPVILSPSSYLLGLPFDLTTNLNLSLATLHWLADTYWQTVEETQLL